MSGVSAVAWSVSLLLWVCCYTSFNAQKRSFLSTVKYCTSKHHRPTGFGKRVFLISSWQYMICPPFPFTPSCHNDGRWREPSFLAPVNVSVSPDKRNSFICSEWWDSRRKYEKQGQAHCPLHHPLREHLRKWKVFPTYIQNFNVHS